MSGTKIIKVSPGDTFGEIIEALKDNAHGDADEVILILPKEYGAIQDQARMTIIKEHSEKSNIRLTIMTGAQETAQLAMATGIEVMFTQKETPDSTIEEAIGTSHNQEGVKDGIEENSGESDNEELPDLIVKSGAGYTIPKKDDDEKDDVEEAEGSDEETETTEEIPEIQSDDNNDQNLQKSKTELSEYEQPSAPTATLAGFKGNPLHSKVITDIIPPEQKHEGEIVIPENLNSKNEKIEINTEDLKPLSKDEEISKLWLENKNQNVKDKPNFFPKITGDSLKSTKGLGNTTRKFLLAALTAAVLIVGAILYVKLGSVKIVINPKKQALDFEFKSGASAEISEINYALDKMPGQKFEEVREVKGTFISSGNEEVAQKARGEITIYNTSGSSQRLVATTRFESPEGLIFRIPVSIVVPAAEGEDSPGTIKVEILADKAGDGYNIGPTRFTIPGFEGTARFTQFYAESSEPMIGGIIGPSSVVTESDLAQAQVQLSSQLREELEDSIKEKTSGLEIPGEVLIEINTPETRVEAGTAVTAFEMSVSGKAETIAFRKDDIIKLIEDNKIGNGDFELLEDNTSITYSDVEDQENESIFTVSVLGEAAYFLDEDEILLKITGMKEDEVRDYFSNSGEIEKVKITLSPFWVNEIPTEKEKIEIIIDK